MNTNLILNKNTASDNYLKKLRGYSALGVRRSQQIK